MSSRAHDGASSAVADSVMRTPRVTVDGPAALHARNPGARQVSIEGPVPVVTRTATVEERKASKGLDAALWKERERLPHDEDDHVFYIPQLETAEHASERFRGKFWGADVDGSRVTREDLEAWYDRTDKRTDVDKLTDYLMVLAHPSKDELSGGLGPGEFTPADGVHFSRTTVYEEGFGASRGCAKEYWKQHFVEEKVVEKGAAKPTVVRMWRTPDNQVFHNLQVRVREFFDLGGYAAFPDVVTVEVNFRELFDIDATRGTFRVAFILGIRWYDAHFDSKMYEDQRGEQVFARSIPFLTVDGADAGESPVGVPDDASTIHSEKKHSGMVTLCKGDDPPGVLYKSIRISCTFRDDSDLTSFPFDMQELTIGFRLWGSNVPDEPDHGRVLLPINVAMELQHAHPEWYAQSANATSNVPRGQRQKLLVTLNLRRRPLYFIFNVMTVIAMLTTMAFGVFRQTVSHEDYESRCQTTLTLMLSSIAYKFFIADYLPRVSYLTVLDKYIYAGLATCAAIFALNTGTICYSTDCEYEERIETIGWAIIVAFWSLANIYAFWTAGKYVWIVYRRDKHLRVYALNEPTEVRAKMNLMDALVEASKAQERFFPRGLTTLAKRRRRACETLREIEITQFMAMLRYNGNKPAWTKNEIRLPNVTASLLKRPACKVARHRKHQLTRVDLDGDSGIPELLRRAGLEPSLAVLGPLLVGSGLTEIRLAGIYKNGQGSAAINSLLEKVGVIDPSSRALIIGALDDEAETTRRLLRRARQLDEHSTKDQYVVLQGSGTFLWALLKAPDRPISRIDFVSMIDATIERLARKGEVAKLDSDDLRDLANCIVAKLILTSPMLGRATLVYSKRTITKPRQYFTQVWAGYLRMREGTGEGRLWRKEIGAAVALEVGAAKMAYMSLGCAGRPRDGRDEDDPTILDYWIPKESEKILKDEKAKQELARLYTKSVVFAHPYLANFNGRDDHKGLDEHLQDLDIDCDAELFERSMTDRMQDLCKRIIEDWLKPVLAADPSITYVLLFGTAQLRREIADLEMLCGSIASQQLPAIAAFCTELLQRDGYDVSVTFELLTPHVQAECHAIAVREGLGNMDPIEAESSDLIRQLQQTMLDDPVHNTFGCATVGMREVLGMVGPDKFVMPVGLDHAISGLIEQAAVQYESTLPPGRKHTIRAHEKSSTTRNIRRSTLEPTRFTSQASSLAPTTLDQPVKYTNIRDAIGIVTRDLAKMMRDVSSQIRPFHPEIAGHEFSKDDGTTARARTLTTPSKKAEAGGDGLKVAGAAAAAGAGAHAAGAPSVTVTDLDPPDAEDDV